MGGRISWDRVKRESRVIRLLSLMLPLPALLTADNPGPAFDELLHYGLEDLMQLEVYTVSRKDTAYFTTPAALYVIDDRMVERTGASTVVELLQHVPGVGVGRINAWQSTVGVRSDVTIFSNKLLVLMDGRTLYNPQMAGVFWANIDTVFEDIQQVEIVRGPGSSVWGSNAVDGVINIVTKGAEKTLGSYAHALFESDGGSIYTARHGEQISDDLFLRVYGKYRETHSYEGVSSTFYTNEPYEPQDHLVHRQAGLRADYLPDSTIRWTAEVSAFKGRNTALGDVPDLEAGAPWYLRSEKTQSRLEGAWASLGWKKDNGSGEQSSFLAYWDYSRLHDPENRIFLKNHLFNLDYNQSLALGQRNLLDFGAGYRHLMDDSAKKYPEFGYGKEKHLDQVSLHLMDNLTLLPDRLNLHLGTKLEHTEYTGWEHQPNARLEYFHSENQYLWASATRAVHIPTQAERDISAPGRFYDDPFGGVPVQFYYQGNPEYQSEISYVYEAGWRLKLGENALFDLTVFHADYRRLADFLVGIPETITEGEWTYLRVPLITANGQEREKSGIEVSINYSPTKNWNLSGSYSYNTMKAEFDSAPDMGSTSYFTYPKHKANLLASWEATEQLKLDIGLRYTDSMTYWSFPEQEIPAYLAADIQVRWAFHPSWTFVLRGKDLLDAQHPEAVSTFAENTPTEVPRRFEFLLIFRR